MLSATVAGGGGRAVSVMLVSVLTVLVTVLIPVGCSRTYVVNSTVCSFDTLPSPASVECDLRGDSMIIAAIDLSASVRRFRIVNANRVEVRQNALSVLDFPENIHFENITNLTINGNAPVPGERQELVSVTLNRIKQVTMRSGSFSLRKGNTLSISISNIESCCEIYSDAIVSSSALTNVTLENITGAHFYPGTFATTLGELALNNVTITLPCAKKTFAGHISKLSLTSINLSGVQEGCFQGNEAWNSLTIRSSRLGYVSEQGLQGNIGHVRIEESSLGEISPNGFDLKVSSFSINASSIKVLATNALNIRASGCISMLMTNVTTIHENAFRRLDSSKDRRGIILHQLNFGSVVNGSLRMSDVTSLTVRELQLRIPCECNIRKQVMELFFGRSPLSSSAKQDSAGLFNSAYVNIRCLHNHTTPFIRGYHCTNCDPLLETVCDIANRNSGTYETLFASAVPLWVILVVLLGCFLLLGAVITLLVIRHRQRSARRRRTNRPNQPPSQRLTVADLQLHPPQDLPKDGQQIDSTSQSPAGERSGEVSRTGAMGSMVYSSVHANVPEATVGSAVCDNVSGLTSGEDQALYEEIFPNRHTREEKEAGFIAESTQAPPLYAEVNKCREKGATTSDNFGYAADSSDPPVYAHVNKTKARTIQWSGETTRQTTNTETSGTKVAGNFPETRPIDDKTTDMPVYAQVHKNKPDDKKRSVHKTAGHPEPEQSSQSPVYAQVKKNKSTASSQTSRHDPSQQTWQPTDAPLYEEV